MCSILIPLLHVSNLLQNGHFQPILAAIFVTIATLKVESMTDFYTLAIVLKNEYKETCDEQLLFFDLIGGQKSLLMHVPLYTHNEMSYMFNLGDITPLDTSLPNGFPSLLRFH